MSDEFPGKGKVAVLKTKPETVLGDVGGAMRNAGYQSALSNDRATILMINTSWRTWYPASSSTPWQIEGAIRQLRSDGYERLIAVHNDDAVADPYESERNNKHKYVVDKYGVENVHLREPHVEWLVYEPVAEMMVLHNIFPEGIRIPRMFIGKNIIHSPTVRTHAFASIAGAMTSALGGLWNANRGWSRERLHRVLVDLLAIQQEIHPGVFAVMDGVFAGDGPGPRAIRVHEKDILLASADQVAIDAISAKLQGFDPMEIDFIRTAHERGLGVGDPRDIEITGYDISLEEAWNFVRVDSFASRSESLIQRSPLGRIESPLQSQVFAVAHAASNAYQNLCWFPIVGRSQVKTALESKWGELFKSYDDGRAVLPGPEPKSAAFALLGLAAIFTLLVIILSKILRR
jgi:uncharacterized protein (DUF362 family)